MNQSAFSNSDSRQFNELAELLKALSHPVRLCIVRGLMRKKNAMYPICRNAWIFRSRQCPSICRSCAVQAL